MKEYEDIEIKVRNFTGDELTIKVYFGINASDLTQEFRAIMYWLGYGAETIDDYIPDEWRGWKYVDEEDDGEDGEDGKDGNDKD